MYLGPKIEIGRMTATVDSGTWTSGSRWRGPRPVWSSRADAVDLADVDPPQLDHRLGVEVLARAVEGGGELVAGVVLAEGVLDPDRAQDPEQDQADQAEQGLLVDAHPAYVLRSHQPVRVTVLPSPQKMSESPKLRTTMVTIEARMARPTATPTPAGPPEALKP